MITQGEKIRREKISKSLIGNKRRVGVAPWNKGKKGLQKHTEKWKKQLREKMIGNKFAYRGGPKPKKTKEEICKRRSEVAKKRKAEKAGNWKGGITPFRVSYWQSEVYKNWRNAVFQRDDYTCKLCEQRGGNLEAHHIKAFSKYPLLRLKVGNGITLCKKCHNKTKGKEKKYVIQFHKLIRQ